ncbi:MAG: hypothetical protein IJ410_00915 [Oscillospiraceae bacterium]|nr:hypothetical protein [Oscillospiraceae bacterium]
MLEFIARYAYVVPIMGLMFMLLYLVGGEDIIFFRQVRHEIDPKSDENLTIALTKYASRKGFKMMGRTTLEFEGATYTFDGILITYFGTIAIKAEPYAGDIYGEMNGEEWVAIFEGKRTPFLNPLVAMSGSTKLFRDIYRAEGVKKYGQTETMAVFTNKHCNVAVSRNASACHVKDLDERLSQGKFIADNGVNIDEMAAALEKHKK